MLKLAALKSTQGGSAASDTAMAAAAQLSAVPVPSTPAAAPSVPTPENGAGVAQQAVAATMPEPTEQAAPVPVDPPVLLAAVEPEKDSGSTLLTQSAASPARGGSALVNINKASADALDRFPGAGHIGHAIVSHRPYRSVADLLKKRVLTNADFHRIEGRISVD